MELQELHTRGRGQVSPYPGKYSAMELGDYAVKVLLGELGHRMHEKEMKNQYMSHEPSATTGERVICPPCIYRYRRNGT